MAGTPEEVAEHPTSHTGRYLKQVLKQHPPEVLAVCGWSWRGRGRTGSGLGGGLGGGLGVVEWDLEVVGGSLGSFVGLVRSGVDLSVMQ